MTYADYEKVLVEKNLPIIEAVKLMNERAMQVLLIKDDRKNLLGIITDGDIRRAILSNVDFSDPIETIMSSNPLTITYPPDKQKALRLMKRHDVRHLPIVDQKGKIAGLLLWKDFFDNGDVTLAEKINTIVIMAGGKGTRLDLFTKILPKPLIPIGDKPIIEHVMDNFSKYGFKKFLLSLNYKADMIKVYFSDNHLENYEIDFVREKEFLGTAGALSLMRNQLTDTFIVSNCDVLVDANMDRLMAYHKQNKNDATILGIVRNIEIPYGVLKTQQADLAEIVEKPEYHFIINSGIYAIEPELIDLIEDNQGIDMPTLLMAATKKNFKVQVFPMTCSWFDIGQWGEYQRAVQHVTSLGVVH